MNRQKRAAVFLLVSLMMIQPACGRLSGRRAGETGGSKTAPHFKPGFNLFSLEQDIELGRQSAQKIAAEVPLVRDEPIVGYIQQIGARLAAKAPGHKFPYQFNIVGTKEINAFALPGGPIFINAGTIVAAKNEGELVGVIAHEIAHIALRHGTNQASKAYLAKAGLDVLSTVTGGSTSDLGQIINTIGGAGANVIFLKFGRTAETEADLEGARIMAEAGYDPRDMASFFKTLKEQHGQRGPEFLSDHPDPGNRVAAINNALPSLPVSANPVRDSDNFQRIKSRVSSASLGSSKEPARLGPRDPNDMEPSARPERPSASFAGFEARDGSFALEYPQNWDALGANEANLIFAPQGAYGRMNDSVMVTHGIFIGAVAVEAADLESATARFIEQQIEANPDFRISRQPERINFGDRQGFATVVEGPSPVTGVVEIDVIYTTATVDGRLFYLITIAPEDEYLAYKETFERIISSIRLAR
ncbi:MAG TPA: M48 family metallopeptidase [Blastocatellia bacterium]|nr:M48 family metallopeptidase [Blastocatellia bacterium]